MKYGPVVSGVYDCISHWDDLPSNSTWKNTITINKESYKAELKKKDCTFDMLSEEEKDILKAVNNDHREEDQFSLAEYTHSFPEWKNPGQSRIPLPIEDIINASLKDKREQKEALADLELSARLQYISFRSRG